MTTLVHSRSQPLSLLYPPNPAFAMNPPSGGILLNSSRSPSSSPHARTRSLPGGTIPTDSVGADRKIRFAPLPDPRKLSDEDLKSDDDEDKSNCGEGLSVSPSNLSSSTSDDGNTISAPSSREGKWSKKLLKPFLNASPIRASFEDSGGGGKSGTNLFRASSRDSMHSAASTADQNDGSGSRRRSVEKPLYNGGGIPLRPTISADAPKKLLNGRVYGRKKQERDDKEPEFVEWGYGGMGSVRSGEQFYQGVQGGSGLVAHHDDDDDGSGMGWVKRRREQRARENAERDRAAALESANGRSTPHVNAPQITVDPPPSSPREEKHFSLRQEHETATVAVPHHHHPGIHSRRSSRSNSGATTPTVKSIASHGIKDLHIATQDLESVSSSASTTSSSLSTKSSEEDEEEDDTENEEEEEEEDDSEEEEKKVEGRKTTTCAGVEKISRHRE